MAEPINIGMNLEGTHVVVTGAAGQIGQVVVRAFLSAGAIVSALDIKSHLLMTTSGSDSIPDHDNLDWYIVDVTDEKALEIVFEQARLKHGVVAGCVALAGLDLSFIQHHSSICDMSLEQWRRTMDVNATGSFLTARTWLRGIRDYGDDSTRNISLVLTGSEAGVFGVPGNADYAASKSAIQYGLVKSIAPEAVRICRRARVNAIAPGPVDTLQFQKECLEGENVRYQESEATVASRCGIPIQAVAKVCLTLTSENFSSMTNGQVVQIDGGKSGRVLWLPDGSPAW